MTVTGMSNLAVKVADLDEACAFYERAGAEVHDRMVWENGERADVFLGPVMITLFTRAIYEDATDLPAEGFLHPALFTDDLDTELDGHSVVWGPAVVEGTFGRRRIAFVEMVGSGSGGWDVPWSSFEWQFANMEHGRGILVFDDGWHKLSTALWLFGPVREVRAWIGRTEMGPGVALDAPSTLIWEHESGIRGVWDITIAADLYLRSDYYTNDERWEVTGNRGFARVNRCTGRGIQQPSLEVYAEGEMRSHHALDDDWASSFRDSGRHWLQWLRGGGQGPLWWSAEEATEVLRMAWPPTPATLPAAAV